MKNTSRVLKRLLKAFDEATKVSERLRLAKEILDRFYVKLEASLREFFVSYVKLIDNNL